jgi:hypothetical protein
MVSEIIGGTTQTTVKKLNGARLVRPCPSMVEAQPIGRGTTEPVSSLYTARRSISAGSNSKYSGMGAKLLNEGSSANIDGGRIYPGQ